jgi:protocadherin Fat 4
VQHYILVVQATDGGTPSLSSTVTAYCNVVDLNDNAPSFEPGPRSSDVPENATVGTVVLSARAQDLDSGENGHVVYSILSGDETEDFGIANNGTLYTRRALDRETKALYSLVLEAADSPRPPGRPLATSIQVSRP